MENSLTLRKTGISSLLKQKEYVKLLAANAISRFGDSLDAVAYAWMVYVLTGSKVLMGSLFAVNFIPNILFSFFSGVFADRFSKKRTVIICDIGRGVVVCITAILFSINILRPWHLFIFTIFNSTFETFSSPARNSMVPNLIPKELFLTASSFSTSVSSFAELLGAGIAGGVIALLGVSGAILIDSSTFFVSSLLIWFIKFDEKVEDDVKKDEHDYINDFKEGFRFVTSNKLLLVTIFLAAITNFSFAPLNVLSPIYVKDILNYGPEGLSYTGVGLSLGMIIGGLIIGQIGSRFKKSTIVVAGFSFIGICYTLLSLPGLIAFHTIKPIYFSIFMFFLIGLFIPLSAAPSQTYLMENTPKSMLGRVNAFASMVVLCAIPIGSFITGVIAEYVSIPIIFISMGTLITIVAISILMDKDFRAV